MPLTIGDTFAAYRTLRLLGSGGMGEVYLVQHPRLPRQDALKVLRSDFSPDASFRERFIREADLASGLRHPNIVGVHDRGEFDGQLWIAMEYIDGTDLSQLLARHYPQGMPVELVLPIATAVASALDYAHKKGLLHRDVKPANIIVADLDSDDPKIFLADFGIARYANDVAGLTATNTTLGTVSYAAPEQLMGETLTGNADQYALAVTTYQLLSGAPPFVNTNPAVVIGQHLNTAPPLLGGSRRELGALDLVLTRGLAKQPAERFPCCQDFAAALRAASTDVARPARHEGRAADRLPAQLASDATLLAPVSPSAASTTATTHPPEQEPTQLRPAADLPQSHSDPTSAARPGSPKRRTKILLPLVLAVLLLGAAAFSTTQLLRSPPQPSSAAPDWQPYVDYGKEFAVTLMSLDYTNADKDVQRILDGATGSFRNEFDMQRADFVKTAVDSKVVTTATANSAGLESVGDGTAVVLVAATSQVSNANGAKEDPRNWRLVMTVMRIGDDYKVSKVEFAQ